MKAFLILAACFSQNALSGGMLNPIIEKSPPSYEYTVLSQCFAFSRLHRAFAFFMSGLRDRRFEWNQNDSTGWTGTYLLTG